MNRQTFAWNRSRNKLRQEIRWIEFLSKAGLFLAALVLFSINLGNLPLQADEQTVSQVAKEIASAPFDSLRWLFPTLQEQPYLERPPLVHGLIALVYSLAGSNEWTTRLPGAFLAACSVPLLYSLGREIFAARMPSLFSAAIYLTLLPVVRYGRLAMLDGAVLCFEILTIVCIVRSRRDLRWALGIGVGLSLLGLSRGIIGVIVAAIALLFLAWDTPRLLSSGFFAIGALLGGAPALAWHAAQFLRHGKPFAEEMFGQYFKVIDGYAIGLSWHPLLEILKSSLPWLIFALYGLRLAWQERNWGWAKLLLVWIGVLLAIVSLFSTRHVGAIVPIYPALALAGGAALAEAIDKPVDRVYPRLWTIVLSLLTLVPIVVCIGFYFDVNFGAFVAIDYLAFLFLGALSLTWAVSAALLAQRSEQFILVLFWGMYVSWLLLVCSSHWIVFLN
ncbi:PMT family glycosyltransferase, 4-amino-4-deoxy-L-arabinose transferase [Pleurocapsa sp. PCC 7327]|uniref:ArnT family glycosyltransferase n=1 Tax=Pleurocapsa sp. PCC 7327 TaxID=118163 RepID=UPI00029FDBBA|nr:glycosyltransferase family 39 protein [Pleurocapsa sp. PCC 7327]AFY77951.1 PMT family glycosyltransferase, 4-amino-4-deoxy-L-arabinose transferase [Pleurocapsa sp. PCC 7327]